MAAATSSASESCSTNCLSVVSRFVAKRRSNCWNKSRPKNLVLHVSATTRFPKELERICLKALSKRATERYTTAHDLADDLKHFLSEVPQAALQLGRQSRPSSDQQATDVTLVAADTPATRRPHPTARRSRSCPRGCGPSMPRMPTSSWNCCPAHEIGTGCPTASGSGKPASSRPIPTRRSRVGLIYGPSGCGKSSLVKAGLLPRLAEHVLPVYVEATSDETETRLLHGLRKRCPGFARQPGPQRNAGALAAGTGNPGG